MELNGNIERLMASNMSDEQKSFVEVIKVRIDELNKRIDVLTVENALLARQRIKGADRMLIHALVQAYSKTLKDGVNAWEQLKKELLYCCDIDVNERITEYRNNTSKDNSVGTLEVLRDGEVPCVIATILSMCKHAKAEIDGVLYYIALAQ